MIVLVINCGSSSIKYQLLDMKNDDEYTLRAKGNLERIGMEMSLLTHKPGGKDKFTLERRVPDHTEGMKIVLEALTDPVHGVLKSFDEIDAIGHRIVQGADYFSGSVLVDEDVLSKIESCCEMAPLHNPAHLLGIRAMQKVLPAVPQVVTFDTAYHQTMEPYSYMYAIPYDYYENYKVRRYGAHGTSHLYVSRQGAKLMGLDINHSRIITCHLGNGSSITATRDGKCVITSMGFTPLEGLIMGTRCGDIDASAVTYLMKKLGVTPDEMTTILNKKSGFLGLTQKTSDTRDVVGMANEGDPRARLVIKKLTHDIIKYIGAYVAEMNGVDAIVFTGGIGENNPQLLSRICRNFSYLGLKIDEQVNAAAKDDTVISTPDSAVKVAMICTNEELVIARDTMHLVQGA